MFRAASSAGFLTHSKMVSGASCKQVHSTLPNKLEALPPREP